MEDEVKEAKVPRETFTLKDGTEGSRSQLIRQMYMDDGMSRTEIADKLGVSYNIVHAATANLDNGTAGVAGGARVMVELESGEKVARSEYIRKLIADGMDRSAVAKHLAIPYGIVYAATKGMEGVTASKGGKKMVEVNGELVARADYIRAEYAKGRTRREIATELGVDYAVVFNATKPPKPEAAEVETDTE